MAHAEGSSRWLTNLVADTVVAINQSISGGSVALKKPSARTLFADRAHVGAAGDAAGHWSIGSRN